MEGIRDLWANHKALFITGLVAFAAILIYIYAQNKGQGVGNAVAPGTNAPNEETPTVETEQLATILADLGKLTPVTNTLQPINTVTNNTTTITNPTPPTLTTTLTTPPVTTTVTHTQTNTGISGIGNDTARDAAIRAAEKKYVGPSQAAALQQAIAAIQKQYPRSGPTT